MKPIKVLIFGASGYGKYAMYSLDNQIEVVAFIDNNTDCQKHYLKGVYIDAPENIGKYEFDYIIISEAGYSEAMKQQLLNIGGGGICRKNNGIPS